MEEKTVLIVDDLEPMRRATASQLRSFGISKTLLATNGAEALRLLQQHPVDVVLSDWNMPVMTGLELLKAVRADDKLSRLPFVMITAEADRQRITEAIAHEVSDFLVKPYTATHLVERIDKALRWKPRRVAAAPKPQSEVAPAAEMSDPASASAPEPAKATILVVDDTPDNLHLLSQLFKDEYRVRIAHSGQKALEICQSDNPPDLVLLDVMMPGMDGFEVATRMREHPASEHIPVIFVTAMSGEDARLKGLELGAVDFVSKPIDPEVLKTRVRNFLRYVELHKQLQSNYDAMLDTARLREDVEQITRHDMKGPLAGVIGMVQTLADDDAMTREQQTEQLRLVEEAALQVLNMINLSSELYKIETGSFRLDPQPVKIGDILRRVAQILGSLFAEKRLAVAVDAPDGDEGLRVLGDTLLCYSLFHNLIKNACEAAPGKSSVSVVLKGGDSLRVEIKNQGAVPAAIRGRFFDKFATHGKPGGTGLGTYSARLLATAQDGSIELEVSDTDDTTTVVVTLPRHA